MVLSLSAFYFDKFAKSGNTVDRRTYRAMKRQMASSKSVVLKIKDRPQSAQSF